MRFLQWILRTLAGPNNNLPIADDERTLLMEFVITSTPKAISFSITQAEYDRLVAIKPDELSPQQTAKQLMLAKLKDLEVERPT